MLRIFAIIMAIAFLGFTAVQYNDPDPFIWMPIYLYAVLLSILVINRKVSRILLFISGLVFLAGVIYWWPEHWEGVALKNGMKTRFIEEGRESLGLAVCAFAFLVYGLAIGNQKQPVS